jgi:hypothetical protein
MHVYSGDATLNVFFSATSFKMPKQQLKQQNTQHWDPPTYISLCTGKALLDAFHNWPSTSTQAPKKLSEGGNFHTGKLFLKKYWLLQETRD